MQQVLSHQLWSAIKQHATRAKRRRAAIAYVTQDLLGLRKGDLLVTDASPAKIKAGDTDAKLLQKLHGRGVAIYSCPGLHAKVILLDDVAVIGSANMSASSQGLVEVALLTDERSVIAGAEAFLEQLVRQSKLLDRAALETLADIEVSRRRGRAPVSSAKISKLGSRLWVVGVYERSAASDEEQEHVRQTTESLAETHGISAWAITTIRWSGKAAVASKSLDGDRVIQLWRGKRSDKVPESVIEPLPILYRENDGSATWLYLGHGREDRLEVSWDEFKQQCEQSGHPIPKTGGARLMDEAVEADFSDLWRN